MFIDAITHCLTGKIEILLAVIIYTKCLDKFA